MLFAIYNRVQVEWGDFEEKVEESEKVKWGRQFGKERGESPSFDEGAKFLSFHLGT